MADGAVRFLLQTIGSLLAKEAFILGSLRRDLEYIKSKLEIIQSFLKDSDSSKESSSSQKRTWRRQLNDVADDVEDLIDEFIYHMDKHEHRGRFMGFLHNAISLPRSIFVSHGIATRLHEIKAKLLDISESAKLLPHEESSSSHDADKSWPYYAESSHFVGEEELVGIEENKDELIGWLKDKEPQRRVVSVVGMGGLGKTTLVTKVFNSPLVKQHFECYAWISVPQSYKIAELLQTLIEELYVSTKDDLPDNISQMEYRRLVQMLIDYLQAKRYVIVLDNVWNRKAWDDISIAFPSNQFGSRVMLTTRNRELGVEDKVFCLQPLDETDSWTLFCRKAFWNIPNKSLLSVEANAEIVQQVGNLTQLRMLWITKVRKDYGKGLCSSIQRLKGLLHLKITANDGETLQMEELSVPPHGLQQLSLKGHLEKLPHWITSLRDLRYLGLDFSELKEDPLPQIGPLPNLLSLSLFKAYKGQQICFVAGCFPRLQKLYLYKLENLNHVRIEQGSMPRIKLLILENCVGLTTLPEGIEHLCGLRQLHLTEMPEELIEQLKKDGSEVQKMVQHIPIIVNYFRVEEKWVFEVVPHLLSQQENGVKRAQIAPSMDVGEAKNSASMKYRLHVMRHILQVGLLNC